MIYEVQVRYENSYGEPVISSVNVDTDDYPDVRTVQDAEHAAHEIVDGLGFRVYRTSFTRIKGK